MISLILILLIVFVAPILLIIGLIKPNVFISKPDVKWKRLKITIGYIVLTIVLFIGNTVAVMFEPDEVTGELTKTFVETAKICFQTKDDPQKLKALLDVIGTPSKIIQDSIVVFNMNEHAKGMYKDKGVMYTITVDNHPKIAEDFTKYCEQNGGVFRDDGICVFNGYGLKMETNIDGTINLYVVEDD